MAEKIDDELLIEKFRRGDESAFERIVERYSVDVATLANRLLGWPGEVEDVTQEIFLAAFLCRRQDAGGTQDRDGLATKDIRLRLPRAVEADESLMNAEDFQRVRLAVAALPAKYREPVVLRYLQELGTDEISRILGISKNTLYVRLSRARKRLEPELAELIER